MQVRNEFVEGVASRAFAMNSPPVFRKISEGRTIAMVGNPYHFLATGE